MLEEQKKRRLGIIAFRQLIRNKILCLKLTKFVYMSFYGSFVIVQFSINLNYRKKEYLKHFTGKTNGYRDDVVNFRLTKNINSSRMVDIEIITIS